MQNVPGLPTVSQVDTHTSVVLNPESLQVKVRLPSKPALHAYTMVLPNASVAPSLPLSSVSASLRTMLRPSHTTGVVVFVVVVGCGVGNGDGAGVGCCVSAQLASGQLLASLHTSPW